MSSAYLRRHSLLVLISTPTKLTHSSTTESSDVFSLPQETFTAGIDIHTNKAHTFFYNKSLVMSSAYLRRHSLLVLISTPTKLTHSSTMSLGMSSTYLRRHSLLVLISTPTKLTHSSTIESRDVFNLPQETFTTSIDIHTNKAHTFFYNKSLVMSSAYLGRHSLLVLISTPTKLTHSSTIESRDVFNLPQETFTTSIDIHTNKAHTFFYNRV